MLEFLVLCCKGAKKGMRHLSGGAMKSSRVLASPTWNKWDSDLASAPESMPIVRVTVSIFPRMSCSCVPHFEQVRIFGKSRDQTSRVLEVHLIRSTVPACLSDTSVVLHQCELSSD